VDAATRVSLAILATEFLDNTGSNIDTVRDTVRTRTRPVVDAVKAALPGSELNTFASHDLVIEYRVPKDLTFSSRCAKRHPRKKVERLMASIRPLGFNTPVAVDAKGVLIAGQRARGRRPGDGPRSDPDSLSQPSE
jgi:hypothetical protein